MSGVWTERSVPMTDHECAVEALEEIGATILASNNNQIRLRINGQEWTIRRQHGRYSIRYNRATQSTSLNHQKVLYLSVQQLKVQMKLIGLVLLLTPHSKEEYSIEHLSEV